MKGSYEILPFFLYSGVNELLQNEYGITVINDKDLSNLLFKWDRDSRKLVSYDEIYSVFCEDTDELISFLINKKVLKKSITTYSIEIKNIVIVSDDLHIKSNVFSYLRSKLDLNVESISVTEVQEFLNMNLSTDDMIIVSLTKYSFKDANLIREKIIDSNSISLFGYYYAGNYYIDNLYKTEWYNPCHQCNLENIKAQLRINTTGDVSYQEIIDDIYKTDSEMIISTQLPDYQKDFISLSLFSIINNFIGDGEYSSINPESLSLVTKIDLNNNKVYKDFSVYWELCDCYEK